VVEVEVVVGVEVGVEVINKLILGERKMRIKKLVLYKYEESTTKYKGEIGIHRRGGMKTVKFGIARNKKELPVVLNTNVLMPEELELVNLLLNKIKNGEVM